MEASPSAQRGAFLHHPSRNWHLLSSLRGDKNALVGSVGLCAAELAYAWAVGSRTCALCGLLVQEKLASKSPAPRGGFQPFCLVPWDNAQHMAAV